MPVPMPASMPDAKADVTTEPQQAPAAPRAAEKPKAAKAPSRKRAAAAAVPAPKKATATPAAAPAATSAAAPAAAKRKRQPADTQPKAKAAVRPSRKPAAAPAPEAAATAKPAKHKLVRDSFTIPKSEYAAIEVLKQRGATLGQPVKKSELLRAGLMLLSGLGDKAFAAALRAVPTLKTGRPKQTDDKA